MVLINVKTYRHLLNGQSPTAHTSSQANIDTPIKDILPPGVMSNLNDYNISFSLSYPGRENIEKSSTIYILNNYNIEDLFSSYIITPQHELNIRIGLAQNSPNPAPRLPRVRPVNTLDSRDDADDGEVYGGGLRSSKRRKSKKRKSKRKSKRRSKKSKKRKSKTRRRSR
jgi:hypothetical protein